MAQVIPQASGDRGRRQDVVAGNQQRPQWDYGSEQRGQQSQQLQGKRHEIDRSLTNQNQVGYEDDEVQLWR